MKKKIKTLWKTYDRQGVKFFSKRPEYLSGHDYFSGDRVDPEKIKGKVRILRRFKCKVTGQMAGKYGYPTVLQVTPQ